LVRARSRRTNPDGTTAYDFNTDETVKFPSTVALVWRWTDDRAFLNENYDFSVRNLRWSVTSLCPGSASREPQLTRCGGPPWRSARSFERSQAYATSGHIGQAFLGEEVAGVNLGENWISIDPSVDYDEALDAIEDVNDAYPGLFRETQTSLDERIEEVISGGKEPIVVRIYGENLTVLREKAAEIEEIMGSIEGVQDEHTDVSTDVPRLQVEVDLAKAEKYGLKPGDVRRAAATLVAGEEVGDIFRAGKAYDVVVWSTPQTRTSVPDIQNLRIDTPSGKTVRLADVADVSLQPSPNAIDREGDSRRLDVSATFQGDLGAVVQ
jgi:Cu/Ag efflux pump CusA